jgi:hypothetical protein
MILKNPYPNSSILRVHYKLDKLCPKSCILIVHIHIFQTMSKIPTLYSYICKLHKPSHRQKNCSRTFTNLTKPCPKLQKCTCTNFTNHSWNFSVLSTCTFTNFLNHAQNSALYSYIYKLTKNGKNSITVLVCLQTSQTMPKSPALFSYIYKLNK